MAKNAKQLEIRDTEEIEGTEDNTFDNFIDEIAGATEDIPQEEPVSIVTPEEKPIEKSVAKPKEKPAGFTQFKMEADTVSVLIRETRKNCIIGKTRYDFIEGDTIRVSRDVERVLREAKVL